MLRQNKILFVVMLVFTCKFYYNILEHWYVTVHFTGTQSVVNIVKYDKLVLCMYMYSVYCHVDGLTHVMCVSFIVNDDFCPLVVSREAPKHGPTRTEVAKMEAEINYLKRSLKVCLRRLSCYMT